MRFPHVLFARTSKYRPADRLASSVGLSPSWEVTSRSATRELPKILRKPKVHYRVHKSPPLVPISNQMNTIHTPPHPISLGSILILFSQLHLGLPIVLFPSGFFTTILCNTLSLPFVLHALPISSFLPCSF
jgi:hypothetical protein